MFYFSVFNNSKNEKEKKRPGFNGEECLFPFLPGNTSKKKTTGILLPDASGKGGFNAPSLCGHYYWDRSDYFKAMIRSRERKTLEGGIRSFPAAPEKHNEADRPPNDYTVKALMIMNR